MKIAVVTSALLFTVIAICIWVFYKPARIIVPEWAGVSCHDSVVCTDDVLRLKDATILYDDALRFVETSVGKIKHTPRLVFCNTAACSESFGLGKRTAITVGTMGIVIGPRGWQPHYVRHEMIHYLQYEKLGLFKVYSAPAWFTEGMAYALSNDPRHPLASPFEQYRSRFENWYKKAPKERLWEEAEAL